MSLLLIIALLTAWTNDVTAAGIASRRSDDATVGSLMTLVQQQATVLQQQEARLQALQTQVSFLEHSLSGNVSLLQSTVSAHAAVLDAVNSRLNMQVFFTAHIPAASSPVNIGLTSPVVFNAVVTNIGGGYNPATGIFTAPVPGVYVFYAQLMKHLDTPFIHWAIALSSGSSLCRNTADDNHFDKSSCLATARLSKGQQVVVRRVADYGAPGITLEGNWWCSFSGFLVSMDS